MGEPSTPTGYEWWLWNRACAQPLLSKTAILQFLEMSFYKIPTANYMAEPSASRLASGNKIKRTWLYETEPFRDKITL